MLTAKDWGQSGGNQVRAEFRTQGPTANLPLSVDVNGKLVEVFLATDANGASKSTAAEVVAAINAKPEAAALLTATTYRGNAGAGIVPARARVNLSDFLAAPASVARGPFQQHLYRIGTHRDGTKPGVFLFCQQHAREWATGLTCVADGARAGRELRDRPADQGAPGQRRGLHLAELQPGRRALLDVRLQRRSARRCRTTAPPPATPTRPLATPGASDMNRNSG